MENIKESIFKGIILGLAVFVVACSSDRKETTNNIPAVKVQTSLPVLLNLDGFSISGQIESKEIANISTRMMGIITKINVKPGDKVQAGQLLISIYNEDIIAKRSQTEAMITESEVYLQTAKKDYERFKTLYEQKSVSAKELENVHMQYQSAQSRYETAKQSRNEVNAMLSYTHLTAPFSGTVTQKLANIGDMANPGVPILIIEQVADLRINASVAENDITRIKINDNAQISVKSLNKSFEAKVSEISPSSQFNGQYNIKINIPKEFQDDLYPGMYINAFIPSKSNILNEDNKLMISQDCIFEKDQLKGIYVVSDGKAILRWLRLGKYEGNLVEVLSGLSQNEKVVISAEAKLYNGVTVVENN